MPTDGGYPRWVMIVSAYLEKMEVATFTEIQEETKAPEQVLRRMIKDKILTSSLNYNHIWITTSRLITTNRDHWGFFQRRLDKYSRTIPIFHVKRDAKSVLSYLASKKPWGITGKEAEEFLGRDCARPLKDIESENRIQSRILSGEKIYLNRVNAKADLQIKERKLNPKYAIEIEEDDNVGYIKYEEFCQTFKQVLREMNEPIPVEEESITALLMMLSTSRSLRTMESWINFNDRIQDAIGLKEEIDHSTLCRHMGQIDENYLKRIFHRIVGKLHDKGVITGKFLVIDATHIYAFCNTRKNTKKYGVEGASWGTHHGRFYGYKVHILIDAESELPVSMILSTGKDHDSPHFIPLLDDCLSNNDLNEIEALLADGGYDVKEFRKLVAEKTGGIFLPACNPRKSKVLQRLKARVKKLFDTYGDNIESVQDGFRYLGQTFLTNFGIEVGDAKDNKLVEMITERLHRPLRAGVERVFSRLKALSSFENPKARDLSTVKKTIWLCFIGYLIQALTAYDKGLKRSMRKRTALV
jgi:hypothetical protein